MTGLFGLAVILATAWFDFIDKHGHAHLTGTAVDLSIVAYIIGGLCVVAWLGGKAPV